MTTNQAFNILSNISGPHVARIILDATPNISRFKLWRICRMLKAGIPVAKIIHNKWFYGLKFYTNKWTLDPRPDTETLVTKVLTDYKKAKHITIADLGTGTGCIICAIAKNLDASGIALEKSYHAIRVANKNIIYLDLSDKVTVKHGDFANPHALPNNAFDVIVSNPPYIDEHDPRVDSGAIHDPQMALYAKHNGLAAYEQIAKNAKKWLKQDGRIYLEIGINMQNAVQKIFTDMGWTFINSEKDLGGIIRVLIFKNTNK